MSMAWRKVLADLSLQRNRALVAAVAVMVGTIALCTAWSARAVLKRSVETSFASAAPPAVTVVLDVVDDAVLAAVREIPGVEEADARRLVRARAEVSPGEWVPLLIYGVRDFTDMRVSKVRAVAGTLLPPVGGVALEQSALTVMHAAEGSALRIRTAAGNANVTVSAVVHDAAKAPGWQDHEGYAYVTPAFFGALGLKAELDEVHIRVAGDRDRALSVSSAVAARMEAMGRHVRRVEVPLVQHPHADHMNVLLVLLGAFGALAFVLAAALVSTVLAFVMGRASREIAIMKTMGASSRQVLNIYLRFVVLLTLPAVLVGVGASSLLAHLFEDLAAAELNLWLTDRSVPAGVQLVELLVCALAPILASLPHILRATRASVKDASMGPANSTQDGPRSSQTRHLARTLAWRGVFRRRVRTAITVGALALGGAALLTAMNVASGLLAAVDGALERRGDDIEVRLVNPVPADALRDALLSVPGVGNAEVWGHVRVGIELNKQGSVSALYSVLAPPPGSIHVGAQLVRGRIPVSGADEVAVNAALLDKERSLRMGGPVVLVTGGRRVTATIVGVFEELAPGAFYAAPALVDMLTGPTGLVGAARMVLRGDLRTVAADVEDMLVARGWFPTAVMTKNTLREALEDHLAVMLTLLSLAAAAALIIGGLSLAATASLNVLERARELAIIRAMGSSDGQVRRLLLTENAMVAGLAYFTGVLLSAPLTALVGTGIAKHGLYVTIPFIMLPQALAIWTALVAIILVFACVVPSWRARCAAVTDVLAQY